MHEEELSNDFDYDYTNYQNIMEHNETKKSKKRKLNNKSKLSTGELGKIHNEFIIINDNFYVVNEEESVVDESFSQDSDKTDPQQDFVHDFYHNSKLLDEVLSETDSDSDVKFNDNDDCKDNYDKPLFSGCPVSLKEFVLTFETLKLKHHLNEIAAKDILKMIKEILPKSCLISSKLYHKSAVPYEMYNTCVKCKTRILDNQHISTRSQNKNLNKKEYCSSCNGDLVKFVTFDMNSQLNLILKNELYMEKIRKNNSSS